MKKKILWISPYAPYDGVAHGGGKTHNFYVKYINGSGRFAITLLSLCMADEEECLDLDRYGIENEIFVCDRTKAEKLKRLALSGAAYHNRFDRCGGVCLPYERRRMIRLIKKYVQTSEKPDVVILHWTFSLMLLDRLKKYFPDSLFIAIEEDVTFLNAQRRAEDGQAGKREKSFWKTRCRILKKTELKNLQRCDLVVTNNLKDTQLLKINGIEEDKIFTAAPYFEKYAAERRRTDAKDILFWGAMSRPENYRSAVWFIEKVLPKLDPGLRFVVAGNAPDRSLKKYEGPRVHVTGYVEDVQKLFSDCLCLAAPLLGGAGIKIKILEAMSAGVPVLTNGIGIEGIEAKDGRDYLFCRTPEDYVKAIGDLQSGGTDAERLSQNAVKFIEAHYDLRTKLDALMERIQEA